MNKKMIRFSLFLSLLCCLLSVVFGRAMAAKSIADIRIEGTLYTPKERILNILPFKKGDPWEPSKLTVGVENLKKWEIFDKIETKIEETREGVIVTFTLHEGEIISEINITGNYPYIQTKIRKRLSFQVGDMLVVKDLEEQKKRIQNFYEKRGYYDTEVGASVEAASVENDVNVTFHIIKGERIRYQNIQIEGVQAFLPGRIYSFIKPMDLYSEKRLKNSLQKLLSFYRARGYLKAQVNVTDKKIDWEKRRVSLKLAVSEGPKVNVLFKGRPHYRLKALKKTLTIYQNGNFDTVELEESRDALIKRFQKDGFKEAKVTFEKKKIAADLFTITFFIIPGPTSYIQSIEFSGNNSVPPGKIRKQLLSKEHSITQEGILEKSILEEDQKIIEAFYRSKGFSDVVVSNPEIQENKTRTKFAINFRIDEGELVTVEKIIFLGNESVPKEKLLEILKNKEGKPLNEVMLQADSEQIDLYYDDHGHPYAQSNQTVERQGNKITITYSINEGPLVKIGEILIVGDVLTGVRAIKQAMEIQSNDPYSYQKIIDSELNLRRLGAFTAVHIHIIGIDEKATTVHLKVEVEEREPFVVALEGQYSTDRKYAGTLKFTNYNSFGWAKRTGFLLRGGKKTSRAEVSWFDPRFISADIQATLSSWLDYEKDPIQTSLQTGGAVAFYRQFHRFGFLTRYELTRNYSLEGQALDPRALRNSTLSEVTTSVTYDTRNSFSDPSKGIFTLTGANIFNEIKGLEANFAKLKQAASFYLSPLRWVTFAHTLRVDSIQGIGSNISVPQIELYRMGGDDTVRGFTEDSLGPTNALGRPFGGRSRFIYNGELRLRIVDGFQGALFFDAGSLTNSFNQMTPANIRRSAGFGLRYLTPVGPIRADYGIVLDRKPGNNFGRFHFTFGYPF